MKNNSLLIQLYDNVAKLCQLKNVILLIDGQIEIERNYNTMTSKNLIILIFTTLVCAISCKENIKNEADNTVNQSLNYEKEKIAILETLNNETKAAFQRDYEAWKENWVHDPNITKTYLNFADNTFSESIGWDEISGFVKTYIEEHPDPEPLPSLLNDIDIRLYNKGAWVTYEQGDSIRGLKRESRLMEKVEGKWKIAGMQTNIYGFKN